MFPKNELSLQKKVHMKKRTFNLSVSGYLYDWLMSSFGEPVAFPKKSHENIIIIRHLTQHSSMQLRSCKTMSTVKICIPDNNVLPPEKYSNLSYRGQLVLNSSIRDLFTLDMWSSLLPLLTSGAHINEEIDRWCESKNISLDNREAVRQHFYRMRKKYREHGIILGKLR